jgi:hypothetical protein
VSAFIAADGGGSVLEGSLGAVLIAIGLMALIFRRQSNSFFSRIFPMRPRTGFLYVWQFIVGPVFILLIGAFLLVGAFVPK